jgi:hypothetical protein
MPIGCPWASSIGMFCTEERCFFSCILCVMLERPRSTPENAGPERESAAERRNSTGSGWEFSGVLSMSDPDKASEPPCKGASTRWGTLCRRFARLYVWVQPRILSAAGMGLAMLATVSCEHSKPPRRTGTSGGDKSWSLSAECVDMGSGRILNFVGDGNISLGSLSLWLGMHIVVGAGPARDCATSGLQREDLANGRTASALCDTAECPRMLLPHTQKCIRQAEWP